MAEISKLSKVAIADVAKVDAVLKADIANLNGLTIPSAAAFLLDTYTGAAAAYSVRRLNSAYTGACMRVREDGGNTETDIGFDANGDLDTAAIASHCGANNGFVRYWYDQSTAGGTGSGNDASAGTAASQPQIYNGAAVFTENGKPIVKSNSLTTSLNALEFSANFTNDSWLFAVCLVDQSFSAIVEGAIASDYLALAQSGVTTSCNSGATNVVFYKDGASWSATTRDDVYTDLLNNQSLIAADFDASWTSAHIGYTSSSSVALNPVQEFIIWTSDQSSNRTGIESNINSYFSIY